MPEKLDVLYLACGRPMFTDESLLELLANTPPEDVGTLAIYTDGDNATADRIERLPIGPAWLAKIVLNRTPHGGPVAIMGDFLLSGAHCGPRIFAKVDNDLVVCPNWIERPLSILDLVPDVDLLGIEPWCPELADKLTEAETPLTSIDGLLRTPEGARAQIVPHEHIGGIGFMRKEAFRCWDCEGGKVEGGAQCPTCKGTQLDLPIPARDGRFGFTEWQWKRPAVLKQGGVQKGFLSPPLPVFLLDHLPFEPWQSLTAEYVRNGVMRHPWALYPPNLSPLWDWWIESRAADQGYEIVAPTGSRHNARAIGDEAL